MIAVPRILLVALATLVAVSLLAVAYLLGRQAAPASRPVQSETVADSPAPRVATPAERVAHSAPPEQASPPPVRRPPARVEGSPSTVATETKKPADIVAKPPDDVTEAKTPASPTAHAKKVPPPIDPAVRRQISDYFTVMDKYLAVAKNYDTVDSVTQAAILQATRGNPREFQNILRANRTALDQVRTVTPPEPCRAHHQLAQKVLVDASMLIGNVSAATMTGNMDDLGEDMAPAARALRARVDEMREIRIQICHRYGVPLPERSH